MKKLLLTLVVLLFSVSAFAGDMAIQPSQLPANAQDFIKKTFAGTTIVGAQKDNDSFEEIGRAHV